MTEARARIGIVLRTLDRPYFLERALRDILDQTIQDWRVVVANDGGDLATVRGVVDGLQDELAGRATILDVPRPGGRCAAANLALQSLAAPYAVLHDDDDSWDPSFLETTASWLDEHPDDAGVMVSTEIVYEREVRGRYVETGRAPFWAGMQQITYLDLLTVNRAVPISFLYRRAVHDEVGYYDESLETVEDWDFYLRLTLDHHVAFLAGRPLAFWRQRPHARNAASNSMFSLSDSHRRDQTIVRDRAVREYAREHGPGLPHLVAGLVRSELDAYEERVRQRRSWRSVLRRVATRITRRQPSPPR